MISIIIRSILGALAFIIWTSYCYTIGEREAAKRYAKRYAERLEQLIKHREGEDHWTHGKH